MKSQIVVGTVGVLAVLIPSLALSADGDPPADDGRFDKPVLGVLCANLPDEPPELTGIRKYRWPTRRGVLILAAPEGGPAAQAGISFMDVLYRVNDERIDSNDALTEAVGQLKVGDQAKVYFHNTSRGEDRIRWKREGAEVEVISYADYLKLQMKEEPLPTMQATRLQRQDAPNSMKKKGADIWYVRTKGALVPYLQIRWIGDDWLFIRSCTLMIDGKPYEVKVPIQAKNSDNTHNECWEWCNLSGNNAQGAVRKAINALSGAKSVELHYFGDTYKDTYKLEPEEVDRIRESADFLNAETR